MHHAAAHTTTLPIYVGMLIFAAMLLVLVAPMAIHAYRTRDLAAWENAR